MSFFNKFIALWERYQHYIGMGGLALGFTFDLFLAKRPDSIADNILLVTYIFIAGAIIVLLNLRSAPKTAEESPAEPLLLLLILQFCFGGLANNLLILYGKSGTFAGSVVFVGLLAALALSNEFLKSRYAQLRLNIAIYYFLVLTYCVISVPTFILHEVSVREFLLAGAASLIFMVGFLGVVYTLVFHGRQRGKQVYEVSLLVVIIFAIFNGFYFLNIIPPVPLSLKQIGIYHDISHDASGDYTATYEPAPWFAFWRDTSATYTVAPGAPAYCFSAVFAPGGLSTPIYHRWEYLDTDTGHWLTVGFVSFPINGGRAQGYRGFSVKHVLTTGQWRCDVETASGQLIGRITFHIEQTASTTPLLSTVAL